MLLLGKGYPFIGVTPRRVIWVTNVLRTKFAHLTCLGGGGPLLLCESKFSSIRIIHFGPNREKSN